MSAGQTVLRGAIAGLLAGFGLGLLEVLVSAYFGASYLQLRWHWLTYGAAAMGLASLFGAALGGAMEMSLRLIAQPVLRRLSERPWTWPLLVAVAILLVCADATVLVRLYPWMHGAELLLAWALLFWCLRVFAARLRRAHPGMLLSALLACAAALALTALLLAEDLGVRRSLQERGGVVGMVLLATHKTPRAGVPVRPVVSVAASVLPATTPALAVPAVQSVLLITVDALRADRFSADTMPKTYAWAKEHAVIYTSAFTARPHTSHALSALFLGTDIPAELLSLDPRALDDSLPQLLRRHSFFTLAFFPPAVFSVDKARFASVAAESFGFEDAHVGFRSAAEVCTAGRQVLERINDQRYLLWLHLFDPHEPYELLDGESGDTPMARYDLEVRRVDVAVENLLRSLPSPSPLVVFTADHGEEFGEHGGHYHGTTLYDEQVRVPLFVMNPGVAAGTASGAVGLSQLASFVATAAGLIPTPQMNARPLPSSGDSSQASYAFATLDAEEMVADLRYKLLCEPGSADCRLFDRQTGPGETEAADDTDAFTRLLAALQTERQARATLLSRSSGFPVELLAAEAGQARALPAVLALVGHRDPLMRARAVRVLGEKKYQPAALALRAASTTDLAMDVRLEASLALARLDLQSIGVLRELFLRADAAYSEPLKRRAARFLAESSDAVSVPTLLAECVDDQSDLEDRRRSVQLLGALGARDARPVLEGLLADHALRTDAATSLGQLRDKRSLRALKAAFRNEIYPGAKLAEARALTELGDRAAQAWLRRQ